VLAACTIGVAITSSAMAHSVIITRGEVMIDEGSLHVVLRLNGEDLLHERRIEFNDDDTVSVSSVTYAAEQLTESLAARLAVRDDRGEELQIGSTSCTLSQPPPSPIWPSDVNEIELSCSVAYALSREMNYVSLQQRLDQPIKAGPVQFVLAVRRKQEAPRALRISDRGNVEIVLLKPAPTAGVRSGECDIATFTNEDPLTSIRAVMTITDGGVRVDAIIPLTILKSWIELRNADRDFITSAEQLALTERVEALLESKNPLEINGKPAETKKTVVNFLDLGELAPRGEPRRLSVWTTRLIASRFYDSATVDDVKLTWTLFNASVLSANALIVDDKGCTDSDFSSYSPTLRWTRSD